MQDVCIAPFRCTRHRTNLYKWHLSLSFGAKPVTFEKPYLPALYCCDQSELFGLAWIPGVNLIYAIFFQFPETDLPTRQLMVHQPWPELRIIMVGEGKKLESKCSVSKLVKWQMTYMIFLVMFNVIWFKEFYGWLSYLEYEMCSLM